jgi:4-nitrophenyl phosphatase
MLLRDFDAVFFDMDGTLYREHRGLPGAAELIAHLRDSGRKFACVTNNSANTAEELRDRLAGLGVEVPSDSIYTACQAMAAWVRRRGDRPRVFNFAGHALPVELAGDAEFVEGVTDACDVVAVATHMRENRIPFDFERSLVGLNLLRAGADLLVGCRDRVFPIEGGGVEFGSGSWAALFAFAAGLPPERITYAGKPEPEFFAPLCRKLGVEPSRCLMVGDNLESDIQGGRNAGMRTALVLTGVTRPEVVAGSAIQPDAVFADLVEVREKLG